MELRDDIYIIMAYHQILREWSRRPREAGVPAFGPREIDLQVNLVLSTSYLANLRQVCAGSVKVTLSEKGLAMAYDRIRDIQDRRVNSPAAMMPKRPRKALSEVTYEDGVEQRLIDPISDARTPGWAAPPAAEHTFAPAVAVVAERPGDGAGAGKGERGPPRTMRTSLEEQYGFSAPPPPPPQKAGSGKAAPPTTMPGKAFFIGGNATLGCKVKSGGGSATAPIVGPDAMYRHILERPPPASRKSVTPVSKAGAVGPPTPQAQAPSAADEMH